MLRKIRQHLKANLTQQLVTAVEEFNFGAVEKLCKKGADANTRTPNGPLLLVAVKLGFPAVVEALLKGGASTKVVDNDNKTALTIACENGKSEVVDLLLSYDSNTMLAYADQKKAINIVERSIKEHQWNNSLQQEFISIKKLLLSSTLSFSTLQIVGEIRKIARQLHMAGRNNNSIFAGLPIEITLLILSFSCHDPENILPAQTKNNLGILFFKEPPKTAADIEKEEKEIDSYLSLT